MIKSMLVRLEWFDTRFPRIPVNVQKQINASLDQRRNPGNGPKLDTYYTSSQSHQNKSPTPSNSKSTESKRRDHNNEKERSYSRDRRSRSRDRKSKSKSTENIETRDQGQKNEGIAINQEKEI